MDDNMEIVKLFILDEKGGEIGRLVMDMGALMSLYASALKHKEHANPVLHDENPSDTTSPDDEVVEVINQDLMWCKKASGVLYLRYQPKQ